MFNNFNKNGATVTDKLGLDSEVRELKFGSSFTSGNRGPSGAFHSIKYDFKPASVDKSKSATLEMGPSGQVTISMPHYDSAGSTVFKGSTRPYTKECVLIIDKDTGEFVLEKLSHNVQVKKTRQEGSSKNSSKNTGNLQDVEPAPTPAGPAPRSSFNRNDYSSSSRSRDENASFPTKRPVPATSSLNPSNNIGNNAGRRPNSPLPPSTVPSRHSPLPLPSHATTGRSASPSSFENVGKSSASAAFDALVKQNTAVTAPTILSLTSIEDLLTTTPPQLPPPAAVSTSFNKKEPSPSESRNSKVSPVKHSSKGSAEKKPSGEMSDSSDDSSSSSSSDEDDDDSSSASDMEEVALPPSITPVPMNVARQTPAIRFPPPVHATGSMPNFSDLGEIQSHPHLLSEDLQLSESGSDSD